MGVVVSAFKSAFSVLFYKTSGLPTTETPICWLRQDDYSITGTIRDGSQQKWNLALFSMIHTDLKSRLLLWPIIQSRMEKMEASLKFTDCNLESLLIKFPDWDDTKIFEAHDLFQAFEVDGDGLINIEEMSEGLDNFGDMTPRVVRLDRLSRIDIENTGILDFEDFLTVVYEIRRTESDTQLAKTFAKVNNDIKMIRWMSTVQQIHAGYL